jgi:REP element-mobilizing transposase RayT
VAKPRHDRLASTSNTYFITTSTYGGRNLLQSEQLANLFVATLFSYHDQRKFKIHEFVVMRNHVHLLITPGVGLTIEKTVQFIRVDFRTERRTN